MKREELKNARQNHLTDKVSTCQRAAHETSAANEVSGQPDDEKTFTEQAQHEPELVTV